MDTGKLPAQERETPIVRPIVDDHDPIGVARVGHDGGEETLEVSFPVPVEDGHRHPTGGHFGRRAAGRLHHLGLKKRSSGSSRLYVSRRPSWLIDVSDTEWPSSRVFRMSSQSAFRNSWGWSLCKSSKHSPTTCGV